MKAVQTMLFGVFVGWTCLTAASGAGGDVRAMRARLSGNGIEGLFAECREKGWEMPTIRSAFAVYFLAQAEGDSARVAEEREKRAFGFELAMALDEWSVEIVQEARPAAMEAWVVELTDLAAWLGSADGHGNWLLSERAERLACVPLGKLAASPGYSAEKALKMRMRMKTPRERLEKRRAVLNDEASVAGGLAWESPETENRLHTAWLKNAAETEEWCGKTGVPLPLSTGGWRLLPGKRAFFADDPEVGIPVTTAHRWSRKRFRQLVVDARVDGVQAGLDALLAFRRATGNVPVGEDTRDLLRTVPGLPVRLAEALEGDGWAIEEEKWLEWAAAWAKWRVENGDWMDDDTRNVLEWRENHPKARLEMEDETIWTAGARENVVERRATWSDGAGEPCRAEDAVHWQDVLATSGLDGLLADIRRTGKNAPEILSEYSCVRLARAGVGENEMQRAKEIRAFGLAMARALDEVAMALTEPMDAAIRTVKTTQLVALSEWLGTEHGYGNWLLVKRAETLAWMSLGYLAVDANCDDAAIARLEKTLLGEGDALRFRASVLEKEAPRPFSIDWNGNDFENQERLEDAWRAGERQLGEWCRSHGITEHPGNSVQRENIPAELAFFADDVSGGGGGTTAETWDMKLHTSQCVNGWDRNIRREVDALLRFRKEMGKWPEIAAGKAYADAFERLWTERGHSGDWTGRIAGRAYSKAKEYRLMDLETAILRNGHHGRMPSEP